RLIQHTTLRPQATVEAVRVALSPLAPQPATKTAEEFIALARQARGRKPLVVDQEVCAASPMTGEVHVRMAGVEMRLEQCLARVATITSVEALVNGYAALSATTQLLETALAAARTEEHRLQRALAPLGEALRHATDGLFVMRPYDKLETMILGFGVKN